MEIANEIERKINWEDVSYFSRLDILKRRISKNKDWAIVFLYCLDKQKKNILFVRITEKDRPIEERNFRKILDEFVFLNMVLKVKRIKERGAPNIYPFKMDNEIWAYTQLIELAHKTVGVDLE